MEEGSGGGVGGVASSSSSTLLCGGGRQRFEVELRPGETTIVSWKKLVKDANKAAKNNIENKAPTVSAPPVPLPVAANPALDSRIAPPSGDAAENEANDGPTGSRFSAVIEKIERLYMGKNSSDEEDLNDVPDDDEYDTEDSFIDDTELDEYFQVDNSAIKHDGFFVNRGKLERTNEPAVLPTEQPKKRRRKDSTKGDSGSNDGNAPNKHMKVNKKESRKVVVPIDKNAPTPSRSTTLPTVHNDDVKYQSPIIALGTVVKKPADPKSVMNPSPIKIMDGEAKVKNKAGVLQSKKVATKLKDGSPSSAILSQRVNEKGSGVQLKSHGQLVNNLEEVNQTVLPREKNVTHQQVDMKAPEIPQQPQKTTHTVRKESSSLKPKSTNVMLEKAIRDLEKIVAETRPPSMEVPEADNSAQAVKRRMPPEIKQKLAKVARLAHAIHGKLSKELLNRLMSILGHLIQVRSLKRNLHNMVTMGLSATEEKDERVQQLKKEIDDMVKARVSMMMPEVIEQTGSSDDFQEASSKEKVVKSRFVTDDALEDKICELYDFFVDGLEVEEATPLVRKLYIELAEYWPKGWMNNHGVKKAIVRAKDRRKALHRQKEQEKMKRKKLLVSKSDTISGEAQHAPNKVATDSAAPIRSITTTLTATATTKPASSSNIPATDRPKHDKLKANSSNQTASTMPSELAKKKAKKNPETETALDAQTQHERKSYKQVTPESVTPAPESVTPAHPTVNKPADMA
ncbi:ubinuclein-1 isoform X1 [Lactuca sativa]|uniref:ubinuclein-1 isoform X1 n=1 Tax=Lactuca sativa TaxID=4236 RepID=UPI000CD94E74|nr:ubinuclein-1 isoform X1 [Lactuca sativa]